MDGGVASVGEVVPVRDPPGRPTVRGLGFGDFGDGVLVLRS